MGRPAAPSPSHPAPVLMASTPPTLSSIKVESGDNPRNGISSAAVMAERGFQSHSQSHITPALAARRSPSEHRSPSQRRETPSVTKGPIENAHGFLHCSVQSPPASLSESILKENRNLHQRITALQRIEQDLLYDNQELARRLTSNHKRHETRRRQWKEELLNREKVYEARIKDLESRLARQEEQLMRISLDRSREMVLSDNNIVSWLLAKGNTWRAWAEDFAHCGQNLVQSGLHPSQLRELCEGVKHFVQLTENGELPDILLNPASSDGVQTAQALLHGMLANFMTSEILGSPFWVFDVISRELALESPSTQRHNFTTQVESLMDLATCTLNSTVGCPRIARAQLPGTPLAESRDLRKLPRSARSPDLSTTATTGLLDQYLPTRQEMEGLYHVLSNVRGGADNARAWRSSVMKAFCEGGMSTEVDNAVAENTRVLAKARHKYAMRLKDVFLKSPARFLLQDEDTADIEKLERRLLREIDAALRFSCQLWCGRDTPRVSGLGQFPDTTFRSAQNYMVLCQEQTPLSGQPTTPAPIVRGNALSGYHDGYPVIMVAQPAVEAVSVTHAKGGTKIWAKARVLVAAPLPPRSQPAAQDSTSQDAS
ncbi:hypothetical protein BT67DRAFT_30969 [Trichocladium antarcticum]|uniref:Uncharacterized protein n=1 Tax=Trichocladium antarcticum TaxID=1450529 RepID=A0AAN6UU30_9PEZI|nr:hypothetical protein BT67DRAFT_30969 [Trichocladium antarcticum]